MTMLATKLTLHDVEDVEEFAGRVLRNWCRRTHAALSVSDKEDAIAYLVATAWELAERFDASRSSKPFRSYAYSILTFRCTDWLRQDEGRTRWQFADRVYERERPQVLSLDAPAGSGFADGTSLGETLAARGGDGPSDPGADGAAWLLAERRRCRSRDLDVLGAEHARLSTRRARAA